MNTHRKRFCQIALLLLWALPPTATAVAADPIPLRAGPLTMVFDADNAFLRYVKAGPHEVLRGINAPVRNQVWGTVLPQVSKVELEDGGDHFSLSFEAHCREGEIDFRWRGTLTGTSKGEVEFTFDGVAYSTFLRNRIGFCVLHGPSAAGQPWVLENVRGEKLTGRFPTFVAPHQPAKDLRAISHEAAPGIWAHVRFEGDVFEMEDQRNWTDASFKTYCTPLDLPYPARVAEGTKISQKIRFSVEGEIPRAASRDEGVILTMGKTQSALPRLGLQMSSEVEELSPLQLQRLQALHLDHLHVNLQPSDPGFARKLRQAAGQAKALGVTLHVALHLDQQPERELERLAAELLAASPPVSAWLVIGADQQLYQLARKHLGPLRGNATIGVGIDTNFVDLNRDRPAADTGEAVSYAMNPQIHAFDDASIVETLPIQGDTVRTARQFIGDRPLFICPITLRPQQVSQEPLPGILPPDVDARQTTLFAAAWTLGSIKYLAESGVAGATYYETVGWKGIMDTDLAASRPSPFPAATPGAVFPVYHVLRDIGEFAGGGVQDLASSDTLSVVGLALRKPGRIRLLIANLSGEKQTARLRGLGEAVEYDLLDAMSVGSANRDPEQTRGATAGALPELPLVLPPHAIVRIDRAVDE